MQIIFKRISKSDLDILNVFAWTNIKILGHQGTKSQIWYFKANYTYFKYLQSFSCFYLVQFYNYMKNE